MKQFKTYQEYKQKVMELMYYSKTEELLPLMLFRGIKNGTPEYSEYTQEEFKDEIYENDNLNYWKQTAEEDYVNTPTSVLNYIIEMERIHDEFLKK